MKDFSTIRALLLDSDGVLTDSGVYISDAGTQFRRFNIKDGAGIKGIQSLGIHVAIISSSEIEAVRFRAAGLKIDECHTGVRSKLDIARQLTEKWGITLEDCAFMGDDVADLELMGHVGLPIAPADAMAIVKDKCAFITRLPGGQGAVREVCDALLATRNTDASIVEH